jgi:pilus assembly protein FimV
VRKLTKTLTVMAILAPASAYSLGIGGIKVLSGLNQNLNAEISLVTSENEDVSNISVNLAPPAKFDEAKVPWTFFLSKIKFVPVVKPNGTTVIKVSSNEVLKEPFLDFLLEVNWPKGSLYRQFTVLLEPPAEYQKVSVSHTHDYENFAPAPVQRPNYAAPRPRRQAHIVHANRAGNVTRKHDTLWKVAERTKVGDETSVEQMMIALYEANPQAFYKDNINALLPDKALKIPDTKEVLSLSQTQALEVFNQQMRAWENNTPIARREEPAPPVAVETKEPDKQLTLVAPTDAAVADDAATSLSNDTVKNTDKPSDTHPEEGDANGQDGEAKTGVNIVSPGQDVKTDKMLALEKQLADIQKNLAQKEQQLNTIQNAGKPLSEEPENKTPTYGGIEATSPVIKPVDRPKVSAVKPAIQNPLVKSSETDTTYLWFAGIGGGLLALMGWLWWRKRKFDEQFDGESMFAPSSMIKPSSNGPTVKPAAKGGGNTTSVIGQSALEDNSFLNEFTASDFEVFDTSNVEIDPISETDVYLAYGRYQQAEELMRQAIKDQPDNDEYKLKLLEIFCATERKKDFVNYATELANAGKKDQAEFWGKVTEMGGEVWSDLPLLAGGELFVAEPDVAGNIYTNLTLPDSVTNPVTPENPDEAHFEVATFDTDFEESLMDSTTNPFEQVAVNGSPDFDSLSDIDTDVVDNELQNNDSIDFDLGALSANKNNITATPIIEKQGTTSLAFSLDKQNLVLEDEPEIEIIDFESAPEDIDEFDLDSLMGLDDSSHSKFDTTSESLSAITIDTDIKSYDVSEDFDFDMEYDLTKSTTESSSAYFDNNDNGFDFMDLDEMETKIDLAKAYIDMGDPEAAKDIIAEVLDKGNSEQVKTARNLFDSLAAE